MVVTALVQSDFYERLRLGEDSSRRTAEFGIGLFCASCIQGLFTSPVSIEKYRP